MSSALLLLGALFDPDMVRIMPPSVVGTEAGRVRVRARIAAHGRAELDPDGLELHSIVGA